MGMQSLVIGKQFGEGFQYGKRKISAMTNEEFNKLTPADIAKQSAQELREMIPSMKEAIQDMRHFQSFIVNELIATVKQLPSDIFGEGTEGRNFVEDQLGLRSGLGISNKGFIQDIKDFYERQIAEEKGGAFADTGHITTQQTNQQFTSGPIGPSLPQLDSLYRNLNRNQIKKVLSNRALPQTQRTLLNAILKAMPRTLTPKEAIAKSGQSGIGLKISTNIATMKAILKASRQSFKNIRSPQGRAIRKQQLIKQFLSFAKKHNQLMALNRKNDFMVDTAKSMSGTLIFKR